MEKQPIENLMSTTMENIRDMVDVNTVIGDPVQTPTAPPSFPFRAYRSASSPAARNTARAARPCARPEPTRFHSAAARAPACP